MTPEGEREVEVSKCKLLLRDSLLDTFFKK